MEATTPASAALNQTAVDFYARLLPSEFEKAVYAMAGKIAMHGCNHGRLCLVQAMHAAALANSGPGDTDHDTERAWRHQELPLISHLMGLANRAYSAA